MGFEENNYQSHVKQESGKSVALCMENEDIYKTTTTILANIEHQNNHFQMVVLFLDPCVVTKNICLSQRQ